MPALTSPALYFAGSVARTSSLQVVIIECRRFVPGPTVARSIRAVLLGLVGWVVMSIWANVARIEIPVAKRVEENCDGGSDGGVVVEGSDGD